MQRFQPAAALIAALVFLVSGQTQISAEPPQPEALGPLQKAMQRIENAKSLTVAIDSDMRVKVGGEVVNEQSVKYQSAAQHPNKFALRVEFSGEKLDAVASNEDGLFFLVNNQSYLQMETPESFEGIADVGIVPLSAIGPMLYAFTMPAIDNVDRILEEAEGAEIIKQGEEGKSELAQVRVKQEAVVWDYYLTSGDDPQLEKLVVDLTEQLKQGNPQLAAADGLEAKMELVFRDWKFDGDVPSETFDFDAPADSTGYSSLEELQQALAGGGPHPLQGKEAPAFQAKLIGGDVLNLARHKGKEVVVLDFWATWCGPCVIAMPIIEEVVTELSDKGIVLYAVNVGEGEEEINEFLKEKEFDLAVALDPDGDISDKYRVTGIPQTVLIGKDGVIQKVHVGFRSEEQLKTELTEQLTKLADGESLIKESADKADTADEAAE